MALFGSALDRLPAHRVAGALSLLRAGEVVAFTGAGISVESGIPDFRGGDGIWDRFDPWDCATLDAFRRHPERTWEMIRAIEAYLPPAHPNPGHLALTALQRRGRLRGVITQNVDTLHEQAGTTPVLRYHGGMDVLHCLWCGANYERSAVPPDFDGVPYCQCGRALKPTITLFGEGIREDVDRAVEALLADAKTLFVIGTSGLVEPAAGIPRAFAARGGNLVEVGLRPEREGDDACHYLRLPAGDVLPALVAAL